MGYDQYCPIAQALDLLGDRWTLLILRELAHAPVRFTDIQAANPGLSPHLLTKRIGDLQRVGVIAKRELPPPGRATVYALTELGERARPVLQALGRFGAQLLPEVDPPPERLLTQLRLARVTVLAKRPTVREDFVLILGGQPIGIHVGPDSFEPNLDLPERPAATIATSPRTMAILANGGTTVAEAEAGGELGITGDRTAALRLLRYLSIGDQVTGSDG